ncbi:hypothetical protein ATANTOWER_026008 [Ataeniobius toweri]|uniref:Uncharacterized protein n=1 Tax=Ataeniobius toweri TaxID=208326 RepID=A0ABU7A9K9_9TELE|nr:hypothetical protein [Ataeniobius toweri]
MQWGEQVFDALPVLQNFPVVLDEVCTHCSRDFGPLLHTDLLHILQASGLSLGNTDFQLPPKIFNWAQVWRLARHSRTLRYFLQSHYLVALAVCFGSLQCWNTQTRPIFNTLTEGRRSLADISPYVVPPPCFMVGMVLLGLYSSFFFLQTASGH